MSIQTVATAAKYNESVPYAHKNVTTTNTSTSTFTFLLSFVAFGFLVHYQHLLKQKVAHTASLK